MKNIVKTKTTDKNEDEIQDFHFKLLSQYNYLSMFQSEYDKFFKLCLLLFSQKYTVSVKI